MALRLYFHPLSSFCHKALIGLYEAGASFEREIVDLGDPQSRADFERVWPLAKFPVLRDEARGVTVAEASVIVDYIDAFHPGPHRFTPADPMAAIRARQWDRFFDLYVHVPMQRLVADIMRPEDKRDAFGVALLRAEIAKSYAILERELEGRTWFVNDQYGLVECAASPALFYAKLLVPFAPEQNNLSAYYERLIARPSYLRALAEAEPYFKYYPGEPEPRVPGA